MKALLKEVFLVKKTVESKFKFPDAPGFAFKAWKK
jgi:hypothetical protein